VKILWVKAGKILPPDTGGKLRSYNTLRRLSTIHEVTFLSYYGGNSDQEYEREISRHLPGTISVNTGVPEPTGSGRHVDYLRHLLSAAPYAVSRFTSAKVRQMVAELLDQRQFDVAICDFLASAPNFPSRLPIPTILFQHNVESMLWKRRAQYAAELADRLISSLEYKRMLRYETAQVSRFHHVIAVSESDRQAMSHMTDSSRISVVPTGVDLDTYTYNSGLRPALPLVVFAGSMDWEPNIDGVEYFCKSIWPQVLAQQPKARFRIVGRNPDARVKKLALPSVEITGTVASVVDHLREAAVLVVPLRMGGGTRIKIYEGMALGKATVSTLVGAEGLDVRHGHDIMLTDDPNRFAEYVATLLRDEGARRKYELAAVRTARQYDWAVVAARFAEVVQKATQFSAEMPIVR
jgi:glycosyltransferase involved in cell wall biosynthesis